MLNPTSREKVCSTTDPVQAFSLYMDLVEQVGPQYPQEGPMVTYAIDPYPDDVFLVPAHFRQNKTDKKGFYR